MRETGRRPAAELFNVKQDPACLNNLADNPDAEELRKQLHDRLMTTLRETGDARVLNGGDIWETYPRVSSIRWFEEPAWARDNPNAVPDQPWLDQRRPKRQPKGQ